MSPWEKLFGALAILISVVALFISWSTYTTTQRELLTNKNLQASQAFYEALDLLGAEAHVDSLRLAFSENDSGPTPDRLQRLERARRAIETFAILVPDSDEAFELMFYWSIAAGDLDGAITLLQEASPPGEEVTESQVQAFVGRILVTRFGQFESAFVAFKRAIELAPEEAGLYADYGWALHSGGDNERSITMLEWAVSLDPAGVFSRLMLGHVYQGTEMPEEAEQILSAVVGDVPENDTARNVLGAFYALEGRYDEAVEQFREAIRLVPNEGMYYANLGRYLRELGRHEEAEEAYRSASQWWDEPWAIEELEGPLTKIGHWGLL